MAEPKSDRAWRLECEDLRQKLNTFQNAVEHVTELGKSRRSFSTGEGWAMVHKDRLLDLEIAAEMLDIKKGSSKKALRKMLAEAEARIDELMLEYCPDEMSEEQLKVWGDNQQVAQVAQIDITPEKYTDLINELRIGVGDTRTLISTAAHVNAVMFEAAAAITVLRASEKRARDDYMQACSTIARMHAAAIGRVDGPEVGVIEDVAKVREDKLLLRRILISTYADLVEMHVQHGGFLFVSPVVEQIIKDTEK